MSHVCRGEPRGPRSYRPRRRRARTPTSPIGGVPARPAPERRRRRLAMPPALRSCSQLAAAGVSSVATARMQAGRDAQAARIQERQWHAERWTLGLKFL